MQKLTLLLLFIISSFCLIISSTTYARSGCCSHHWWVCGCWCCDWSSLSNKCAPYYPQCNSNNTYTESNTSIDQYKADNTTNFIPPSPAPAYSNERSTEPTTKTFESTRTKLETNTSTYQSPSAYSDHTTTQPKSKTTNKENDSPIWWFIIILLIWLWVYSYKNKK